MVTVWGRTNSINVQKVMWALAELAVPHRRIDAGMAFGVVGTSEYRRMNPNGLVPTIEDGGLVLFGHNGWFLDLVMLLVFCAIYGALAFYFLRRKDGPTGKPFGIPLLKMGTWVEVRTRLHWLVLRVGNLIVAGVRVMTHAVAKAFDKGDQSGSSQPPAPTGTS